MAQTKVNTTAEINKVLSGQIATKKRVRIGGLKGHDSITVGIDTEVEISVDGDAGDFFGAFNDGGILLLRGSAGRFLGDSQETGELILIGPAGGGAAQGMRGGTLIVKGEVAENVGHRMLGGTLIVDGNAGPKAGHKMQSGTLVVTGDLGRAAGMDMSGGRILVGGEIESLGKGVALTTLTEEDKEFLMEIRSSYGIKKKLMVFEKVIPKKEVDD